MEFHGNIFFDRFRKGLPIEHAAIESIPLETK